ncbi:MAG TPA: hypothetical protein VHL53_03265 [Acidimicrobiia bacterium]|nr:hypothetical protein [Acidimicrobiia bacterium]
MGRVSFRPVSARNFPDPVFAVDGPASTSNDAFGRLDPGAFAAYGTGTVLHSDPALNGTDVAATLDLAASDAVYTTRDVPAFSDELQRPVISGLKAGNGLAHARAAQVDPPDALGDVDTGEPADSSAPPTGDPVVRESQADLTPLTRADALRSEASARAVPTGCVIGREIARGAASADQTDIADTDPSPNSTKPLLSLSADTPPRAVSQSTSIVHLTPIPGRPGRFGAVAETRQTIAPVTFGLPGSNDKYTIEVGGEWVLRAAADGTQGVASLQAEKSDNQDRPVLRLINGKEVLTEADLPRLGDRTGIFLDGQPIGDIRIGGEARALNGPPESTPVESGVRVAAAADVVVVRLFEPQAELRIGHMEVALAVPAGGIPCPGIAMTKTANPASVAPGQTFKWNIEVANPNDCLLEGVKVTDTPVSSAGVDWKALASLPRARRSLIGGRLDFDTLAPLDTGQRNALEIDAEVEPDSAPGTISNRAVAVGTCGDTPMAGAAETTTTVAAGPAPTLPGPNLGLGRQAEEPAGRSGSSHDTDTAAAETVAIGAPSSATRSGFAAAPRPAPTAGARPAAGPLPRSGAPLGPLAGQALGLVGVGLLARRSGRRRS